MPKLIKNGVIVDTGSPEVLGLEQWLASDRRSAIAVELEPGETIVPLLDYLDDIPLVRVNFPTFMDGRGFSYARELRERGYQGEIRAVGNFMRDQLTYLVRCGFNAFQPAASGDLESWLESLSDFSEAYQASIDRREPLFRRRA
ncbi:MAG: DUF934 domain-containing protein [Pseudomonadota bacterium]